MPDGPGRRRRGVRRDLVRRRRRRRRLQPRWSPGTASRPPARGPAEYVPAVPDRQAADAAAARPFDGHRRSVQVEAAPQRPRRVRRAARTARHGVVRDRVVHHRGRGRQRPRQPVPRLRFQNARKRTVARVQPVVVQTAEASVVRTADRKGRRPTTARRHHHDCGRQTAVRVHQGPVGGR